MPRTMRLIVLLVLMVSVAACGGGRKSPQARWGRPSVQPPAYPAPVPTPLDPRLRDAARLEIMTASQSEDPLIRAQSMEAIRIAMPTDGRARLISGLTDSKPLVRKAALFAIGELRLPDAKPQIERLIDDRNPHVRVAARFALHRLGDYRYSHDLEIYAQDPDPNVRGDTVLALGLLGEPSALKILRQMRNDPAHSVRLQVAEAMWRLRDDDALQGLVATTLSQFPDDQMLAVLALAGPRDSRVLGHVLTVLTTEYEEVNLVAARAAGMLGSDAGYGVAMKGIQSNDIRKKYLAAFAFGAIGRSDAQVRLAPLLKHEDPNVRLAAATAILQLKP